MINIKRSLKQFQSILNIDITIKDLMSTIDAISLDIKTIFPFMSGQENMNDLSKWTTLKTELKELELRMSTLFDTEELQTLTNVPMKWYWVYNEESTDIDVPIYIMFKYYYKDKWSDIKLYYVQKETTEFLNNISVVNIEIRYNKDPNKLWFYKSVSSGKEWKLQTDDKKVVEDGKELVKKSNPATETFRPTLKWEDILELSKRSDLTFLVF